MSESSARMARLERLVESGAVAVVRTQDAGRLPAIAEALLDGGITAVEVTMTTPDALSAMTSVKEAVGDGGIVGVGSVTDAATTRAALQAGAEFVVSPVCKASVVEAAHADDVPAVPGAFTPTEAQRAHEMGADLVKVFPASMGGPDYIRALKAPLPHLTLMPTGGVGLDDAGAWLQAGAAVVGVGSALLAGAEAEGPAAITDNARQLRQSLDAARASNA